MRKVRSIVFEDSETGFSSPIEPPYVTVEGWCELFPLDKVVLISSNNQKETLSPEWIKKHTDITLQDGKLISYVPVEDLEGILVPNQGAVLSNPESNDGEVHLSVGFDGGTESYSTISIDEAIESLTDYGTKYKLVEKPVIPYFVAEYFDEYAGNRDKLFDYILTYQWNEDSAYDDTLSDERLTYWIFDTKENLILTLQIINGDIEYEVQPKRKLDIESGVYFGGNYSDKEVEFYKRDGVKD